MDAFWHWAAGGFVGPLASWQYLAYVLMLTHGTIAGVTIFLHRTQAHRALTLHPSVSHAFRFWLWLTTGMRTREWVAIHRKHHAKCETVDDPHSPKMRGLKTVLFQGSELYREEAKNQETLARYGHGTPDDWLERQVYTPYHRLGVTLMLFIDVALFGAVGVTLWAVQMLWIPVFAAGVINGLGHAWGYRHFDCPDQSTNIVPWGILVGGEELHNNHHAYPTSAKLSSRWYECDLGWGYIRLLSLVGLARISHVAPRPRYDRNKMACDLATLEAVQQLRYSLLRQFDAIARRTNRTYRGAFQEIFILKRNQLIALWENRRLSQESLLQELQDWQARNRTSNLPDLRKFAERLPWLTLRKNPA